MHSPLGGSVFNIALNCAGFVRMTQGLPGSTNDAAEQGTCVHNAIEFAGRLGLDVTNLVGQVFNKIVLTDRMAENGQVFVAYMRLLAQHTGVAPMWEQRVTLSSLGDDVYGTADGMLIDLRNRVVYVADYKNGYALVEADAVQFLFYGIGALDTFDLWQHIDQIVTVVVQPNVSHVDGSIRAKTYTMAEVIHWHQKFKAAVEAARAGGPTTAGSWCTWCKASGFCRSRWERTLQLVMLDKQTDKLDPKEVSLIYGELATIKRQLDSISDHATSLARQGHKIDDYKLVKAITRARCVDDAGFISAAVSRGVPEHALYEPKLKSMTALKKIVPADIVNQHFVKAPAGTVLAILSDNRPAISNLERPSAAGLFPAI